MTPAGRRGWRIWDAVRWRVMVDQIVELLDRRFAFPERQAGADLMRQLPVYAQTLVTNPDGLSVAH